MFILIDVRKLGKTNVSGWVVFARVLYENEPVGHMYGHTAMTVI
jgi:hypothetical protein